MTEQDRSKIHAAEGEYRAVDRSKTPPEIVMLQYPSLIQHFKNHVLEKRDEDGNWQPFTA